jgi:hypothetical protein
LRLQRFYIESELQAIQSGLKEKRLPEEEVQRSRTECAQGDRFYPQNFPKIDRLFLDDSSSLVPDANMA